jgi:hypothetical protein
MTNQQQHPIAPPPELVEKWANDSVPMRANATARDWEIVFATRAAQWGADQELEACCKWLREAKNHGLGYEYGQELADRYRAARRPSPKPPSAVAQAKALIERHEDGWCPSDAEWHVIQEGLAEGLCALEQLDD